MKQKISTLTMTQRVIVTALLNFCLLLWCSHSFARQEMMYHNENITFTERTLEERFFYITQGDIFPVSAGTQLKKRAGGTCYVTKESTGSLVLKGFLQRGINKSGEDVLQDLFLLEYQASKASVHNRECSDRILVIITRIKLSRIAQSYLSEKKNERYDKRYKAQRQNRAAQKSIDEQNKKAQEDILEYKIKRLMQKQGER